MPICKKCNNKFPNSIKIDGIWKYLNSRKYCLDCSPYGKHNTRNLDEINCDEKKCPNCNEIKNLSKFYSSTNKKISPYCIDCSKIQSNIRTKNRKKLAVEYKGGCCIKCGYNDYIEALDFHHREKESKFFNISHKLRVMSFEKLKIELDKCDLLCCRCHREIEADKLNK